MTHSYILYSLTLTPSNRLHHNCTLPSPSRRWHRPTMTYSKNFAVLHWHLQTAFTTIVHWHLQIGIDTVLHWHLQTYFTTIVHWHLQACVDLVLQWHIQIDFAEFYTDTHSYIDTAKETVQRPTQAPSKRFGWVKGTHRHFQSGFGIVIHWHIQTGFDGSNTDTHSNRFDELWAYTDTFKKALAESHTDTFKQALAESYTDTFKQALAESHTDTFKQALT